VADDNNGNGKVTNAVQNNEIEHINKSLDSLHKKFDAFINDTTKVRMHCQNEFGTIGTHIKILWALVSAISIGSAIAIVRAVISSFTT